MRILALGLAFVALTVAGSARAQPAPPASAIREFDIATIETLGRLMYRQDAAAWAATDALLAKVKDPGKAGIKGWIVEGVGDTQRVRFLRDAGAGLEVAYDIDVGPKGEAAVHDPVDRALAPEERAAFAARQTAIGHLTHACGPGYNTVVLHDPQGPGWLVWLLAPMRKAGDIPIAGHFRFTISADGSRVERADALSNSCLVMTAPPAGSGKTPVALVVSHVVSPTPVETHVFLQIQSGQPMYVLAGGQVWKIDHGHIAPPQRLDTKP